MPNVLDAEPLRALARRAGLKIDDAGVRARFERLAFQRLMSDARNFRPATGAEIDAAPDWAHRAFARGEVLSVCKLDRGAAMRLHGLARQLSATCRLARADIAKRAQQAHMIAAARAFLLKIERASFEVARDKARVFARLWSELANPSDFDPVCERRVVKATYDRVWLRVISLAELRALGREFRNCLARAERNNLYGAGLCNGRCQFWVLRDRNGRGLVVVMASAPHADYFDEAKGPRNGSVNAYQLDLALLAEAIGFRPDTPPSSPAGARARVRAPCSCQRCLPSAHDPPLRLDAPAP